MPRKPVAVVAAMRRELAPLLRGIRPQKSSGVEFFELEQAVVAVGGIGPASARRASEAVIARYAPGTVISAGIAGALSPRLKVGDVVSAREVADTVSGKRFAASGGESVIATASSVSGPDKKRLLADMWGADVVDMEAAAVAAVAQERQIEFSAIKAVSDEVDFVMPPMNEFVDNSGSFRTLQFAIYIVLRPKWWSAVMRLNTNSRLAALNLSEALKHLIDQRSETAAEKSPGVNSKKTHVSCHTTRR